MLELPAQFLNLQLADAVLLIFLFKLEVELSELIVSLAYLPFHLTGLLSRLSLLLFKLSIEFLFTLFQSLHLLFSVGFILRLCRLNLILLSQPQMIHILSILVLHRSC